MAIEMIISDKVVDKSFWDFKGEVDYVDDWFLMRTPIPVLMIMIGYLVFVLKLGPEYMKNRPAFGLRSVLVAYNAAQVGMSCYLCYIGTRLIWTNGLICSPCIMDREDMKFLVTSRIYAYFLAKLTELADTIFFVFKKNYHQISILHIYHHSTMFLCTWLALKYEPSYSLVFLGTLNSYIHVVMYTYYGLSAFPELSKYIWWKKYITKMQIIQFILVMVQAAANYTCTGCPPSYIILASILINSIIFIGLFSNFYLQSYKKARKSVE